MASSDDLPDEPGGSSAVVPPVSTPVVPASSQVILPDPATCSNAPIETLTMEAVEIVERENSVDGAIVKSAKAVKIQRRAVKSINDRELVKMCSSLGVKGYKNKKKDRVLELIGQKKMNDKVYNEMIERKKAAQNDPPRKQAPCPFRLINILFSDKYSGRLDELYDKRSRGDLDGAVSLDEAFWKDVRLDFMDGSVDAYGNLAFRDEHHALKVLNIDLSDIVPHKWKKLRTMWKKLQSDYRDPSLNFSKSGNHDRDFYHFCEGCADLLYLYLQLELRPELANAVECVLPDGVFSDSNQASHKSHSEQSKSAAGKHPRSELASAIREMASQSWRVDNERERLGLLQKRELREEQTDEREKKAANLREWTFVCDRLRLLYEKQEHATNVDVKEQLADEIEILRAKKNDIRELL